MGGFGRSLLLIETAFALILLAVDESEDTEAAGELSRCCRDDNVEICVLI